MKRESKILLLFIFSIFFINFVFASTIALISPDDEQVYIVPNETALQNISFISSVTGDFNITNISLLINGVVNQTNSSGIKGNYTFNQDFPMGSYNWRIRAFDNINYTRENSSNNGTSINVFSSNWNISFYILRDNIYLDNFNYMHEGENLTVTIYKNDIPIFSEIFNNLPDNTDLDIFLNRSLYSSLLNQGDFMILNLKQVGTGAGIYLEESNPINITTNLTSANTQFNKGGIGSENRIRYEFVGDIETISEQRVFAIKLPNATFENINVTNTGFFAFLGSVASRITKGWFTDLDVINLVVGNTLLVDGDLNFTGLIYGDGSQLTNLPSKSDKMIIGGRGTAIASADSYYHPSGGDLTTTSNPSQVMYLPYAGTLHNLTFNFNVNQGSGDTCVLLVQNSTAANGTFTNTALSCAISNVAGTCTNTNASQSLNAGSYIKIFFDEQAGTCSGIPGWSFIYEI